MLLPIGLAAGTVLSLINHLRQNEKQEEHNQYKVAIALNAKDIESGMQRALLLGERTLDTEIGRSNIQSTSRFIQGTVSPGGTGQQFDNSHRIRHNGHLLTLSYVDVPGVQKNDFTVVVIELDRPKSKGDAAILGLSSSVIRSLAEANPLQTIRFVLSPFTQSAEDHAKQIQNELLESKQSLQKLLVLKTQDTVDLSDSAIWVDASNKAAAIDLESANTFEVTHPSLLAEPAETITDSQAKATLKAADQLRHLLLEAANQ